MAKFKRRRPKNRRAGCLLCKPHKANGAPPDSRFRVSELRWLGKRRRLTRGDLGDHFDD
ncbi:MAG: hypothetical protein M5U14_03970 [Acidimicrobiia bacterium]|nr:hypothetical protein [Acidimicrobiia bacterium]